MQVTLLEVIHENKIPRDQVIAAINRALQREIQLQPLTFNVRVVGDYNLERQDI